MHGLPKLDLTVLKWCGGATAIAALFFFTYYVAADEDGIFSRYWSRYTAYLERRLRILFIRTPGRAIALGQLLALGAVTAAGVLWAPPGWFLFYVVVVFAPTLYIDRLRIKRVAAIEDQLDGFLVALANALKSTPSIGDAVSSAQHLISPPLRYDIELVVKEMRVGATLDQALLSMAGRVGSRPLDSALSALLIGRQIGGNLPKVLTTTAGTLREMARLEGVVRSKTAEGRMQLMVLMAFPAALIIGFNIVQPGYFAPLTGSFAGVMVSVLAVLLWVASIIVARKLLTVDI